MPSVPRVIHNGVQIIIVAVAVVKFDDYKKNTLLLLEKIIGNPTPFVVKVESDDLSRHRRLGVWGYRGKNLGRISGFDPGNNSSSKGPAGLHVTRD